MKSEEWPIAAATADRPVYPAPRAGSGRLSTVRNDFFLDPAERLNEQERALMTAMLDDLLSSMADEIAAALPSSLDGIGGERHDALIARLSKSRLLDRPVLIALLLRRADEQRLATPFQLRAHGRPPLTQRLVADEDGDIAAAAMALVVARGRRRDRFGQSRLLFDDLPAEEATALAYAVAAGLRQSLPPRRTVDRALSDAAATFLSRHDESERIEALLAGLVRLLDRAQRVDDRLIEEAASEGEVGLVSALLAHRGTVPEDTVWDHLVSSGDGRLVLLARIAGLERATAARLVAELGTLTGIEDPLAELAIFDRLGSSSIDDLRNEWRLPSEYLAARAQLGGLHG